MGFAFKQYDIFYHIAVLVYEAMKKLTTSDLLQRLRNALMYDRTVKSIDSDRPVFAPYQNIRLTLRTNIE